ncbi:hypothetical protein FOA52_006716 [Chlamydomonas sp. UWO 241]|nr:hypothetical protein FOA52_006716 [Chlamydomonas sp. UWO 241]
MPSNAVHAASRLTTSQAIRDAAASQPSEKSTVLSQVKAKPPWSPTPGNAGTSSEVAGPVPAKQVFGPFLRFGSYEIESKQWVGSVLMVMHQAACTTAPMLEIQDAGADSSAPDQKDADADSSAPGTHLQHFRGWNFWRFDLKFMLGRDARSIAYTVTWEGVGGGSGGSGGAKKTEGHAFTLPSNAQTWRWGFYSCNGFHDPVEEKAWGGIQPLWQDVMQQHAEKPIHVMVGGGDQLYNDHVWELPSMLEYLSIPEKTTRRSLPFTQEQSDEVSQFYMESYSKHWSQPLFGDALAHIPQLMTWDDHDIFDGWGSYPVDLQSCRVFKGIFHWAKQFYCLFQQHATPETIASSNGVFGGNSWNCVTAFGPTLAVVVLDARSERTLKHCCTDESYSLLQARLATLPSTIQHVAVIAGVPLIYPHVPFAESCMGAVSAKTCFGKSSQYVMGKTGVLNDLYNAFGEIELLDDLVDHWSSPVRVSEKRRLLAMVQEIALKRSLRFTFVSGDVHVAGYAKFSSKKAPNGGLLKDHRYMPQIISSAIGNNPPPMGVVRTLQLFASEHKVTESTVEQMLHLTHARVLKNQRNWALVEQRNFDGKNRVRIKVDGSLVFQIRLEDRSKLEAGVNKVKAGEVPMVRVKAIDLVIVPLLIEHDAKLDPASLTPWARLPSV